MNNSRHTILAINPGTRYIGVAVFKGPVLFDWSVKVISGKLSAGKLERIRKLIVHLVGEYDPDVIVVKKLHSSRSSKNLDRVIAQIAGIAIDNGIRLCGYSIQEVKEFHASTERMNKIGLAELMCQQHPVLRAEFHKEQSNNNPYHTRMFEAVALGAVQLHRPC